MCMHMSGPIALVFCILDLHVRLCFISNCFMVHLVCFKDLFRGGYVLVINPPPYYPQSEDQITIQLTVTGLLID